LKELGGPEVLAAGKAPDPVPGPGQALIEVAFANITFVETQLRATGGRSVPRTAPIILGNGVGGVSTRSNRGNSVRWPVGAENHVIRP